MDEIEPSAGTAGAPRNRRVLRREPLWPGSPVRVDVLHAPVTAISPEEVFVFGSNATGFHGAGAAGLACRGTAANTWRTDRWFLRALASPPGSPDRIGRWAVLGVARGDQVGREGRSYAIVTLRRPGERRSVGLGAIAAQLRELLAFARVHPALTFLVTPLAEGFGGYSRAELSDVWRGLHESAGLPPNLQFLRIADEHRRGSAPA